jgi:periplasmic protein TonB
MMKNALIFAMAAAIATPAMAQRNDDYPAEARRNGWEGKVVFRALIGVDGRAKTCEIVQSSGYDVLDDTTCEKVIDTARFEPASDERGAAVEGFYQTGFTWELE